MLDNQILLVTAKELIVDTGLLVAGVTGLVVAVQMIFDFHQTVKTMSYDESGM